MSSGLCSNSFAREDLEETPCPVCGGSEVKLVYGFDPFRVLRCRTCTLGYLSPRLKREVVAQLYREGYFASKDAQSRGYADYTALAPLLKKTALRRYRRIRSRIAGGALLDIGCAHGYALDALKEDFDRCCGVDLSLEAIREVERKGHEGHTGDLFSVPWEKEAFDLVLCFDTLEHIYEPVPFMNKVADLLRPGGVTAMATPNLNSWLSRLSRRGWVSFKIPEHVTYFTPSSMRRLFESAGLSVEFFRADVQCSPLALVLDRAARAVPVFGGLFRALARLDVVSRLSVTVPNGMLFAVARKSTSS